MSRKKDRKKTDQKKPSKPAAAARNSVKNTESEEPPILQQGLQAFRDSWQNRPGAVGFWLSMAQLAGHSLWILIIWYLAATDQAKSLNSDSLLSWIIVSILGVSLLLTFVSMFVCLFYGLRRAPRLLPLIGFAVSFFVGVFASSLVFMQAMRSMSSSQ